jgi:hypothetical protein
MHYEEVHICIKLENDVNFYLHSLEDREMVFFSIGVLRVYTRVCSCFSDLRAFFYLFLPAAGLDRLIEC